MTSHLLAAFWRRILIVLLLGSSLLMGQGKPPVIKTELLTLSLSGELGSLYYRNGEEIIEITASSGAMSPPMLYTGPRVIWFYKDKENLEPVPKGETPPKPDLEVSIPKGSNRTLMVFVPNKDKDIPAVKVYGISDRSLGEGDYRIFNFSKQKVVTVLNDQKMAVSPGKIADVDGGQWGQKISDMQVGVFAKFGDEIEKVYSSIWGHYPKRRSFLFVFDTKSPDRPLEIRKFYDMPSFKPTRRSYGDE